MSGSFTGFSEDYIRKLSENGEESGNTLKSTGKENPFHSNKKQEKSNDAKKCTKEATILAMLNEKIEKCYLEPIPENAKLDVNTETIAASMVTSTSSNNEQVHTPTTILRTEPSSPPSNRRINLEVVQARQKLIEEQNKKRKELLSKALADKTKKTLAETQKLKEIQAEFQKLDSLHSGDIKILRKQIELASLDYMEAEKRYYKVEKEFLNSKLDLHLKLERKELLAEHLCAIIEKNEEKKAHKLNEMLSQLNLTGELRIINSEEDNSKSSEN